MTKTSIVLKLFNSFIISIFIVLGIGQIDLIYSLKFTENEKVLLYLGFPFDYFYFSQSKGLQGFILINFLLNLGIVYFLLVFYSSKKLFLNKKKNH